MKSINHEIHICHSMSSSPLFLDPLVGLRYSINLPSIDALGAIHFIRLTRRSLL